jgi:translation initiation factor IF-2
LTRPAATIQKPTVAVQKPAVQPQAVKIEIKEEVKPPPVKTMQVKFPIMVKDLAEKVSVGPGVIIKSLMDMKVLATINQLIGEDDAKAVAEKFGYKLERLPTLEEEIIAKHQEQDDKKEDLLPRPPVVTIMGHVDHGKTSLLDYIRKAKVADQEKGGITQHIGAYEVDLRKGKITFLDTPGHEAFTAMRARGANATDLVVLVVAADDGVMPQTVEALDHARAADVPILVAITKVDKQNIDLDRVKKQLADLNLLPEDWGGKTVTVNVSAKTGEGVDNLLEMILLEAELLELKANPNKPARGVVVEAKLSKGGGPIATVLVQGGTLRQGDIVVCGQHYGKVRALINDKIHRVPHAPPSIPVEILGLNGVPQAGDTFMVVEDDKRAKEICSIREQKIKEEQAQPTARRITLEDLYSEIQKGKLKELNVIIKTDVRGSLEAMADSLMKLSSQAIGLNIIHKGVGDINESDILLAAASNAIVIGFNVQKTPEADPAAKLQQVDVRTYGIIYEAVSDIKAAMEGMLEPQIKEIFIGRVVIKQVFKVSKSGIIAGSYVQKGKITRNTNCRLVRDGQQVYKGKISSLKRFKDDVREVAEGFECGIALENFEDIKAGDIIEAFGIEKIARKL